MSDSVLRAAAGKPTCIALDLCQDIIEDALTHYKTLVHVFQSLHSSHFPGAMSQLCVMATFIEGQGRWTVTLSFRAPSGRELHRASNVLILEDHGYVTEMMFRVPNFPLPEPGSYFVDLLLDDAPLVSRRFHVHLRSMH